MMCFKEILFKQGYMRYAETGSGNSILYIHGLGSSGTEDYPLVFPYIPGFRHLAPDLFGFGHSDKPLDYSYSLTEQAHSLLSFLNYLGLNCVSIVAHSMGGAIALELYRQAPERVQSLVLCEGNIRDGGGFLSRPIVQNYTEEQFVQEYTKWAEQFAVNIDNEGICRPGKKQFARTIKMAAPVAVYRSAQSLVSPFPCGPDFFETVDLPRAWITGTQMLDQDQYERLAGCGVSTYKIPKAGHAMMLDNPKEFGEILMQFLKEVGIC